MKDNIQLSLTDHAGNENNITVKIIDTTIALNGEESNWDYVINEVDKTITLNAHNKNKYKNLIVVYGNYIIDGKTYKTVLGNNDNNTNDYMFSNNPLLEKVIIDKNVDFSKLVNISYMFNQCQNLKSFDLSILNAENVTNLLNMFFGCSKLENFTFGNFNTSNVTNMSNMFKGCCKLKSIDLSNINTGNVINMENLFNGCTSLIILDLSNINTSNVTNMMFMFGYCSSLTSLDLSSFNTRNTRDMLGMFYNCSSLETIKVSKNNWITSQADITNMFNGCGTSEVTFI